MIREVRIFLRNGSSIYAAETSVNEEAGTLQTKDIGQSSLFASMMSAILGFDTEIGRTEIKEFVYEDTKAVFRFLNHICFLVFADRKTSNRDLEKLLGQLELRWLEHFQDRNYVEIPLDMRQKVTTLVDNAVYDVFWWITRKPSMITMGRHISRTLLFPSSSYYHRYLSNRYLLATSFLPLVVISLSYIFGTIISGISTRSVPNPDLMTVATPILILWFSPTLFFKAIYGTKFHFRAYLSISAIYSLYLSILVVLSSSVYIHSVVFPLSDMMGTFSFFIQILLLFVPINLSFFGFIVFTGVASFYASEIRQTHYLVSYALVIVFLISLTRAVSL